jgi:hypothetical protein
VRQRRFASTNKALALAGRTEIRDYLDILYLHGHYLSVGTICWGACGKDQGFTPLSLLDFAKRHMKFRQEDLAGENLATAITLGEMKDRWFEAVQQAETLIAALPGHEVGCLYLDSQGNPVNPDPQHPTFSALVRHFGSLGGAWPKLA